MARGGSPELLTVDAAGLRLGVVASRWHSPITDQLLNRSLAAAKACGVTDVVTARVAGAVELPVVAQALARRSDAVVALGVVIKGDTPHFEYVCHAFTSGLTRVSLDESVPVAHGVLTVDSATQAWNRSGLPRSSEDKGWQATVAVLDAALTLTHVRGS